MRWRGEQGLETAIRAMRAREEKSNATTNRQLHRLVGNRKPADGRSFKLRIFAIWEQRDGSAYRSGNAKGRERQR